jgi:hypothetical protein
VTHTSYQLSFFTLPHHVPHPAALSCPQLSLQCEPSDEIHLGLPLDPAGYMAQDHAESMRRSGFEVLDDIIKDEFGVEMGGNILFDSP